MAPKTPVTLSQIPTITTLYAKGKLLPSKAALQPASSLLNDRISIYRGDITALKLDAIVNAANSRMLGGGGIDGAIHSAAGPTLREECETFPNGPEGRCPTGEARITSGHNLPAKHVIHAVGPNCQGASKADMKWKRQDLENVYDSILQRATENGVKTLGICGISTAIYAYPPKDACMVACQRVREFLESEQGKTMERIVFVTFSDADVNAYDTVLPRWFPQVNEEAEGDD
jgi:O-acetyl-ADP-ribose deacetylase (regulator of RNase III)